ncbi:hypothetical protein ACN47E_007296 [Coniothyrium glycines]
MAIGRLQAVRIEIWVLYAIGSIVIMLRTFSRTRLVGFAGYHADDYLVFFAWACYTGMSTTAHIVSGTGDTSHLTMKQRLALTPEQVVLRQNGTKWFMVGWYTYVGLIWALKLNMLFLYRRLVSDGWVKKCIRPTMIFVGVTGVSIWILLASACRPFHKLWVILPDPGEYCMPQSSAFLITVLVLNLITDTCIILIPIPIVMPLKISWKRKLGIMIMFCAGIFIMIAAILRVYFVLALGKGETAAIWSCREAVVAVIVGQATMIRPLFTQRLWSNNSIFSDYLSNKRSDRRDSHELSSRKQSDVRPKKLGFRPVKDPYNTSVLQTQRNESEEEIISGKRKISHKRQDSMQNAVREDTTPLGGIIIKREVDVTSEHGKQDFQQSWRPV